MSNYHVVPLDREHANIGFDCWCRPRVQMICGECEDDAVRKLDCWQCGGDGWMPCEHPEMYDGTVGLLIVHNES